MLDDFLAQERQEGQVVGSEATFTLDPKKVRERVAVFSEADSLYPFYRCLQAIIAVSSSDIFVQREEQLWNVNFKWPDCPPVQAFLDLLNLGTTAGFDKVHHRVGQHLFFGLSAALGTPNYRMDFRTPEAGFSMTQGELKTVEGRESEYCQLAFTFESSWWQRLTGKYTSTQVTEVLKDRLCYSPKRIHIGHEELLPTAPRAPERPWGAKLVSGSELAWRFMRKVDQNDLTIPYPNLDYYRCSSTGDHFHLIREPQTGTRPLSVAFFDPDRRKLLKGQTQNLSLSQSSRAHSALFLSLESGKQDWLIPVCDGLTTEPIQTDIAGGGIVALTSEKSLQFDLSGLRVIENKALDEHLVFLRAQSKALKKQLLGSLASMTVRSKSLPKHYSQAAGYLTGGPTVGLLAGHLGPKFRNFFSSDDKS